MNKTTALVFYYRYVVEKPLGDLGEWAAAKRPKRLPRLTMRRESPLDRITGKSNILPFNADTTAITRRSA